MANYSPLWLVSSVIALVACFFCFLGLGPRIDSSVVILLKILVGEELLNRFLAILSSIQNHFNFQLNPILSMYFNVFNLERSHL